MTFCPSILPLLSICSQVFLSLLKHLGIIINILIIYYIQHKRNCDCQPDERKNQMQITDIKIRKFFEEGPMKAVVSVTFDDCLAVHDVKVIYARERYFIVMPSRKNPDGSFRDIVHPINAEFRAALENAVIDAYHVQLVAAEHDLAEQDDTYVI